MNHFPFHIGDYTEATAHLSFVEDAAYCRLIRKYYSWEKNLPPSVSICQRLVGARTKVEKLAVKTVLEEFFVLREDGWHNERCDLELERYFEKSDKASASANSRWKSGSAKSNAGLKKQCERNANALPTQCEGNANQEPRASNQEEHKTLSGPNGPEVRGAAADPPAVPDCPHDEIVKLYHELLPENPKVIEWNTSRKGYLRSRWREKAKPNGVTQGYVTAEQGLAWWRQFFDWASQSAFLTGKTDGREGKPPFVADLEWLIRPQNFVKVLEGKYHR